MQSKTCSVTLNELVAAFTYCILDHRSLFSDDASVMGEQNRRGELENVQNQLFMLQFPRPQSRIFYSAVKFLK